MLNNEQTKSMVRMALGWVFAGSIGVWLTKHGVPIDDNFMVMIVGAVCGFGEVGWKLVTHMQANQVEKAAKLVYIAPEQQAVVGIDVATMPDPKGPVVRELATILLIILGLVAGGAYFLKGKLPGLSVTSNQIYAAEATYALALTAADSYRIACVGDASRGVRAVLTRSSCEPVLLKIQSAVRVTNDAYVVIMGYEANPPQDAAAVFMAAVGLLKTSIPVAYLPGVL